MSTEHFPHPGLGPHHPPSLCQAHQLVANILATSVREGMLRVWDTRQASPARTVKRNKLPPGEQETHGGGVVKVKERQVEAKWCPCLHAGGGMMVFLFSGGYWVKLVSHKSKPVHRVYGF